MRVHLSIPYIDYRESWWMLWTLRGICNYAADDMNRLWTWIDIENGDGCGFRYGYRCGHGVGIGSYSDLRSGRLRDASTMYGFTSKDIRYQTRHENKRGCLLTLWILHSREPR